MQKESKSLWNRSSEVKTSPGKKRVSFHWGIGIIIAVLGIALLLVLKFSSKNEIVPEKEVLGNARIKEVTPAAVQKKVDVVEEPEHKVRPQRPGEYRDGKILLPNGELIPVKGVITSDVGRVRSKHRIFTHPSENAIAGILSIRPGQNVVGSMTYRGLTKDFLESLKEPIIPTQDDSEEDQQMKRLVNEAKIELKAAYDRGEDIEKILQDSREECQKLARYKQELTKMTIQGAKECTTAEEVDDYIEAANKMLEAKGVAPLKNLGPLSRLKLRLKESGGKK